MKISVAIATYNGADYIIEQLDSIRLQSRKVDEVIISDDHSVDKTFEIVEKYIEKYKLGGWKIVYNAIGKGLKDNFYNAICQVTGELIFLADQDNRWFINKAALIEKIFEENSQILCLNNSFRYMDGRGCEISFEDQIGTANNGLILHEIEADVIENIPISMVINKNIGPGLAMAVRRDIVWLYLRHSKRIELHDFEINCIAAEKKGLFFYNKELDFYRIFDGQAVSIGITKKRTITAILLEKIRQAKEGLGIRCTFIMELLDIDSEKEIQEYLCTLLELQKVREEVAVCHHIGKWCKEYKMYKAIKKQYGYVDMRYCYIDLLAAFVPNMK